MNKATPPKHRTPNWKQVRHEYRAKLHGAERTYVSYLWEPQPLRASRKDRPLSTT